MSADAKTMRSLREAFLDGCAYERVHSPRSPEAVAEAKVRYPIMVVRPREVADENGDLWKYENGALWWRSENEADWDRVCDAGTTFHAKRRLAVASVLANPTEEIAE